MFRKFITRKNRKGQNTAEYALLISLVVAAIIAMQTYAQRAIQARIRDASNYLVVKTNTLGSTLQYEPYYLQTQYVVNRDVVETVKLGLNKVSLLETSNRVRARGGFQVQAFPANKAVP